MYIPRLRKISDVIAEMKKADPDTDITHHFIETLIYSHRITTLKYGYAWIVNLDELYAYLSLNGIETNPLSESQNKKMLTSKEILSIVQDSDPATIIRRPNLRRFIQNNNVEFVKINQSKWLINFEDFLLTVNPQGIHKRSEMPRIRTWTHSVHELRIKYAHLNLTRTAINNLMTCSSSFFKIRNSEHWVINYDELEKAVINHFG